MELAKELDLYHDYLGDHMPGIQVLEPAPNFGSQLGQQLGMGLSQGLGESLGSYFSQKQNTRALEGLRPFYRASGLPEEEFEAFTKSGLPPQLAIPLLKVGAAQRAKATESMQQQQVSQDSFNRMSELLNEGKLGLGSKLKSKILGGKTAESVGEFESLGGALEALLVDKVSRGALSNSRFKYITETLLPKPNDREAVIRGKMKALARELDLDASVLQGSSKQEKSEEFKVGESISSLPEASKYPNAVFSKGNKKYVSNGKAWKEVK